MPASRKKQVRPDFWRGAAIIAGIVVLVILAYAILRYNVVRDVLVDQIPLYISNKALAVASVVLIGMSYAIGPLARFFPKRFVPSLGLRKTLGLLGFGVAALHVMISMLIFDQSYYPKFFAEDGKLNLMGESSMLFGVLGFFVFAIVSVSSLPSVAASMDQKRWLVVQRLGYIAYALVILHVFVMGSGGWLNPSAWQYGLASLSLIAFSFAMAVLLIRLLAVVLPARKN